MPHPPHRQTAVARRALVTAFLVVCLAHPAAASFANTEDARIWRLALDSRALRNLDDLDRGEIRIVWRRDEPTVELADIDTRTDSEREYDKGSAAPRFEGCYLAAAFDFTTRNRLGGNADGSRGTRAEIVRDPQREGSGYLRAVHDDARAELTLTLFDPSPEDDTIHYLDGRQFDRFVITMRAEAPVEARLRDAADRTIRSTIDPGVAGWRQVEIPIPTEDIHEHHLARLKLESDAPFEIARFDLCRGEAAPATAQPATVSAGRSLWVWHTSDLLRGGADAVDELSDLARTTGIDRIHLQLPSGLDEPATRDAMAAAIAGLNAAGLEVFGLDGAPEYGSRDGWRTLTRALARVLDHNDAVDPTGRFAGVHLDIEPYLSSAWDTDRMEAIASYISVIASAAEQLGELPLDVAVPFWFDGITVREQTDRGVVTATVLDAVLEHADEITVMDYRTQADGSNGILALAAAELAAAGTVGKPVWVGLETTWLPDETLIRFRGEPRSGLPAAGERDWWVVQIGEELLAVPDGHLEGLTTTVGDADPIRHWSAYVVEVPASRQTFHDLGYAALQEALGSAQDRLAGHPAFAGFALHYDRPLRRLVEGTH